MSLFIDFLFFPRFNQNEFCSMLHTYTLALKQISFCLMLYTKKIALYSENKKLLWFVDLASCSSLLLGHHHNKLTLVIQPT